jgi:hypothetical protein
MKITDNRHVYAALGQAAGDVWNSIRGLTGVHGNANEFGTGSSKLFDLQGGGFDVHGIGVRHRLHHDRILSADFDAVYVDCDRWSSIDARHEIAPLKGLV